MSKKENKSDSLMWIAGHHAVKMALLNKDRVKCQIALTEKSFGNIDPQLLKACDQQKIAIQKVKRQFFEKKFPEGFPHQEIALLAEYYYRHDLESYLKNTPGEQTLILLDQVTDPHNLGAIIRSAAAYKITGICVPKTTSAKLSATVAKAASGGLEFVNLFQIPNLAQTIETLKKHHFWCYALDERANESLSKVSFPEKTAFVFGAEGKGLRRLTKEKCDIMLKIPTNEDSLNFNVSIAATLTLYERFRR